MARYTQQRPIEAKPTVLIVSHEPSIRRFLAEGCALDDYPTQTAADAEDGLELLHQARGSCLVMLNLSIYPDMWELMGLLHENRFLRAHHRIIQVDTHYYVEKARSLQPDDVLVMPFSGPHALDVIEHNAAQLRRRKAR